MLHNEQESPTYALFDQSYQGGSWNGALITEANAARKRVEKAENERDVAQHELTYLYALISLHLAMAQGNESEAERLRESPQMEISGWSLSAEALQRVKKASADLYALAETKD